MNTKEVFWYRVFVVILFVISSQYLICRLTKAYSQDISVGPVAVDTGDAWLDFWMVVSLLLLAAVLYVIVKRLTR